LQPSPSQSPWLRPPRWRSQRRRKPRASPCSRQAPLTPQRQRNFDALRDELGKLGWVEGRNMALEYHHANESPERLPEVAAALVKQNVNVFVAFGGGAAIGALQKSTRTVPIVMVAASNPVDSGYIESFARPGGNITGTTVQHFELAAKRLEILKEAVPNLARVAVLYNRVGPDDLERLKKAALGLKVQLQMRQVQSAAAIEGAFTDMNRDKPGALLVLPDSEVLERNLRAVASLAAQHRLPAIYPWRTYVDLADGLMSYGPSLPGLNRRAAYFVDRILRGTKPADLPVELPREFELVVNLKAARALGLTISQRLQLQADEIIQ
jgi:putative ABC transport system substrate-binding protein